MLILKEPLELKSLSPIIGQSDGFFDRMNANYQVLWAKYKQEELFHMMSLPPEIYINEGESATFITQNESHATQEMRLEMVYNLLNRLMMAGAPQFTYQDGVYVQTMLHKLGVKNVSEFMRQLYEMQEDTQNVKQLSELYERNLTVLKRAVRNVKEQSERVIHKPQKILETRKEKELRNIQEPPEEIQESLEERDRERTLGRLHQEIFRRLRSSDVYHTVTAFQKDAVYHYRQIKSQEAGMAEQTRTLSMLRLHELESRVLEENYPLISHRVNLYEEGMEENYQEETVQNELAGAVLLNLSDNFYRLRMNESRENRVLWYQFKGDLRQILEDTLNRFQNSHLQRISGRDYEFYRSYQESVNAFRRQEISRLKEVLRAEAEEVPSGKVFLLNEGGVASLYSQEGVRKVLLDMREELKKRQEEEQAVIMELTRLVSERELIRRRLDTENKSWVFTDERVHRLSGTEELQAIEEINQVSREISEGLTKTAVDAGQIRRLEEEVRRLNEENRRRMKEEKETKNTESFRKIRESNIVRQTVPVQIDKKKTREETLLLLEHPELAEGYYREEKELPGQSLNQEEKEWIHRILSSQEEGNKEHAGQSLNQEEKEWIRRILGSQEDENKEHTGQVLSPEERERFEKLLSRAEEEITVRLTAQEEKQLHIAEEIHVLRQTIDSLERQNTRTDAAIQIRNHITEYRRAEQRDGKYPADYERADIRYRQDVLVYEQIRKELETFLTSLRSLSSLESISRIQEALEGKKRGGREPDGREMAVKKLIILKETLTKLEETMKTEGFERENIKNDRQYETSTEELQKTQTILNRQETRQIYAETLEQIRRIVGGFKIEEKSGGDASKTRKIRTQQKTLLELLRSSEVVIRTEADKRLETMHIPKEFYEKRREIVRNYLHIIGERHISEERMMRGDVRESMRIHRETAAERQKLVEIHRTSEVQKTSGDRKVQMYHKPSETFDREMVMEEIQKQRTRTLRQDAENIHITSQSHTQKNFTERQTQVQTDSLVKKSTENINEMIQKGVQRGVQRQIDNISNQVYHKLERKLSDDRKRRGH
ncbi:MAG: hypothetical protein HFG89_08980 [Dorea sp.]|jgi:hypothetical protein|nr:hypothetical protein [Dorea sp.]